MKDSVFDSEKWMSIVWEDYSTDHHFALAGRHVPLCSIYSRCPHTLRCWTIWAKGGHWCKLEIMVNGELSLANRHRWLARVWSWRFWSGRQNCKNLCEKLSWGSVIPYGGSMHSRETWNPVESLQKFCEQGIWKLTVFTGFVKAVFVNQHVGEANPVSGETVLRCE